MKFIRTKVPRRALHDEIRTGLHADLDRLIDARNSFEAALLGNERFSRPEGIPTPAKRVGDGVVEAAVVHAMGIELAAAVIGEEILLQMQPDFDPAKVPKGSGLSVLILRLRALLPVDAKRFHKHRLVALLWLAHELSTTVSRKKAKGDVGAAYGLGKDAISKWAGPCAKALGRFYDESHEFARALSPEWYFAVVFGKAHGRKSLSDCALAYKACAKSLKRASKRGRPARN